MPALTRTKRKRQNTEFSTQRPLRVLVVDDSAVVRQIMSAVLGTDRRIEVVTASDPIIAFEKIRKQRPDVVVTDLEMPRMDGLSFLRKIMADEPLPVVVCSGFAASGTDLALRALEEGAVEVITKPKLGVRDFLHESAVMLLDAVWSASEAQVMAPVKLRPPAPRMTADEVLPPPRRVFSSASKQPIIAIGASTGGTEALRVLLEGMPADCPPIVIVQHMPEVFTRAFAERLNRDCVIEVAEAEDGDRLRQGKALIAPGNHHCAIRRAGTEYITQVLDGPLVSRHRPSVDVLFRSVASAAGRDAIGVIMTGMGDDGAQGLLEMKQAGARTIAQDESTCVVFGMPQKAIAVGAVETVVPLDSIASTCLEFVSVMVARQNERTPSTEGHIKVKTTSAQIH